MENFETWLVNGCGVSAICHTREGVMYWMVEMVKRGGIPSVTRWAQTVLLLGCLLGSVRAEAFQYSHIPSMSFHQMEAYADNAILAAARDGEKSVTLHFVNPNPDSVEKLASELRTRGYRIDEEAVLLNPDIIKVRYYKKGE